MAASNIPMVRARITHKYLTASAHLAKHIIMKNGINTPRAEKAKGINPPTIWKIHPKGNECNNAQTRSQPIDAIYQIDGIHDEHYNQHCEWPSHPLWNVTDTEYSIKLSKQAPMQPKYTQTTCNINLDDNALLSNHPSFPSNKEQTVH